MQKLTKKQIEDYEQLCRDRNSERLLTPDGLRFICEAHNYAPEAMLPSPDWSPSGSSSSRTSSFCVSSFPVSGLKYSR